MDVLQYHISELLQNPYDVNWLDAAEQTRYQQLGKRYLAVRCELKRELARRAHCAPQDIQLSYTEHGKPYWNAQPELHFNLSHSADLLVIALHHQAIGIDVEAMTDRPFHQLCTRFMPPELAQDFIERGCPKEEFYAQWSGREALIKLQASSMWKAKEIELLYRNNEFLSPHALVQRTPCAENYMACVAIAKS